LLAIWLYLVAQCLLAIWWQLITKHMLAILATSYCLNRNNRVSSFYWTRGSKLCFLTCFSYFSCYFLILVFLRNRYLLISFCAFLGCTGIQFLILFLVPLALRASTLYMRPQNFGTECMGFSKQDARGREKIRPWARGLCVMRVKTIGHGRGGHPCGPNLYSSWLSSIKSLKLVKLLQVRKKVILVSALSMRAWHQETQSTQSTTRPARKFPMTCSPKCIFYILHPLG
jgi:hypothetical protein